MQLTTVEDKLKVELFKRKTEQLSDSQMRELLVEMYVNMLNTENSYKQLIKVKENWKIN